MTDAKSNFGMRAIGAALFLTALAPLGAAPSYGAGTTPQPKIVVIDRATVLRMSKVGQDIVRQVNAYSAQAESDLKNQGAALQRDVKAYQQQAAILSNDLKAKKVRELESRQLSLRGEVQKKQSFIQGGFIKARGQVEQALGPILQGIMTERGANLLLDRNAVVLGTVDVDITGLAVQRLNQKMPTVKVELVAPPPGALQQQQQQQQ
jgi:outer membrane protein